MPILPTTPSPKTFADAWTREFESAVKTAAGKDQRLSVTEARRIAERSGGPQLFSDNAVAYLLSKKQQTVSVSVLVNAARAYAEAKGAAVAGADGKISYADGAKLPSDLRDDFMYLRGKLVAGPPERSAAQLKADVTDLAKSALDNQTAKKLPLPPAVVRGRDPIVERLEHPASKTSVSVWVADGRVYLSRASPVPSPLVGWYDAGPVPPMGSGRAELRATIENATKDLWNSSERDAKVLFVRADNVPGQPTTSGFATLFGAAHDQLTANIYDSQNGQVVPPLSQRQITVGDAHQFLEMRAENFDPADPDSIARAQQWAALKAQLEGNLTDLKLYRAGDVQVSYFVVGKTRSGDLAGILTAAIET